MLVKTKRSRLVLAVFEMICNVFLQPSQVKMSSEIDENSLCSLGRTKVTFDQLIIAHYIITTLDDLSSKSSKSHHVNKRNKITNAPI